MQSLEIDWCSAFHAMIGDGVIFFGNMNDYLRDLTDGMNPADLSMANICARTSTGLRGSPGKYCMCAGPVLEQQLGKAQQAFNRVEPVANIRIARELLPDVNRAMAGCGQG